MPPFTSAALTRAATRGVALTLALAAVFYLSSHLGTFWSTAGRTSSVLYPGVGAALIAMILAGRQYWPTVVLGRLIAFWLAASPQPLGVWIAVGAGNALAAWAGAWVLERSGRAVPDLTELRHLLWLSLAAAAASVLGATVGATALTLAGSATAPFHTTWLNWCMGSLGGALVFTPLALAWATGEPLPRSPRYWLHLAACVAATSLVSVAVFFGSAAGLARNWLVFPALLWSSLAFGVRGATIVLLPATLIGVAGTLTGAGALGHALEPDVRAGLLQQFVAVASFTCLVLAVVADERRGKLALRDREHRLHMALAAARSFGFDYEPASGRVTFTAESAEILGLPAAVASQTTAREYMRHIHEDDRPRFDATVSGLSPARPTAHHTYRFLRPDGEVVHLQETVTADFDRHGALTHVVGVAVDVTERRKAEQEREWLLDRERAARREAERTTLLRDEFLGTVSHELRTPLNAILGWAQILQSGTRTPDALQSGLSTIARNARLQTQLIDDLLDLSRMSSGHLRLETAPLDLATVVRDAVLALTPAASAKGLQVQLDTPSQAVLVPGDADRLQQVFWNLLMNAVKFTPHGGHIVVQVDTAGDTRRVRVSDTGQGIATDFLPHVFDRFRQADGSTTRRHSGLGIGLALVRQLVELHGGRVEAESRGEGLGATFTVYLPALRPGDALVDASGSQAGPAGAGFDGTRPTVLIVDDDADARDVAKHFLEGTGARVLTATCADEGLQVLRRERPDVIVADIGMPDVDGYAFIRAVRQLPATEGATTPAAAVTALARDEDRRRALEAGFQTHLAKPVTREALITVVSRLHQLRNPA
jgi:PAS domain S-box-containing protein